MLILLKVTVIKESNVTHIQGWVSTWLLTKNGAFFPLFSTMVAGRGRMRLGSSPQQACKLPEGRTLSFNLSAICASIVLGMERALSKRKQLVELVNMKSKHQGKHKYICYLELGLLSTENRSPYPWPWHYFG